MKPRTPDELEALIRERDWSFDDEGDTDPDFVANKRIVHEVQTELEQATMRSIVRQGAHASSWLLLAEQLRFADLELCCVEYMSNDADLAKIVDRFKDASAVAFCESDPNLAFDVAMSLVRDLYVMDEREKAAWTEYYYDAVWLSLSINQPPPDECSRQEKKLGYYPPDWGRHGEQGSSYLDGDASSFSRTM
jgi:hypothetical protein